jgi:hypothetical protein
MTVGKKGAKVDHVFKSEQDIFAFLEMEYKEPAQRVDGRAVVPLAGSIAKIENEPIIAKEPSPKNKTVKIRVPKSKVMNQEKEAQKHAIKAEKEALKLKAKEEKLVAKQAEKAEKLALKEMVKQEKLVAKTAKKRGPNLEYDECSRLEKNIKNTTVKNKKVRFIETMESKAAQSEAAQSKAAQSKVTKPENTILECPLVPLPNPIDTGSSDPILHALQHFKTEGIKVLESMNEIDSEKQGVENKFEKNFLLNVTKISLTNLTKFLRST